MSNEINYLPGPISDYPELGIGFNGDQQRWNWRFMVKGLDPAPAYDKALLTHFNQYQREGMTWEPAKAVDWFANMLPQQMNEEIAARMAEAQARLFPPLVALREGNVVFANFGGLKRSR